ncbi:hypothetical protein SKAU_G00238880 [Synaphobranchus kaupii]|uniref:Uncharacterized protein n=1 Tax=Synaphobranchus kaupii TaxID=118154 RepID=A0A9Q1F733_SYNKA|nr:hypothetical protein SKAU_G00238880 [Synaphobranchus kaupii]
MAGQKRKEEDELYSPRSSLNYNNIPAVRRLWPRKAERKRKGGRRTGRLSLPLFSPIDEPPPLEVNNAFEVLQDYVPAPTPASSSSSLPHRSKKAPCLPRSSDSWTEPGDGVPSDDSSSPGNAPYPPSGSGSDPQSEPGDGVVIVGSSMVRDVQLDGAAHASWT